MMLILKIKMGSLRLQIQQFKKAKIIQVTDILVPKV
jgi:hypothetical protein